GTVTLVYDHHRRELVGELTEIQHGAHRMIISSQHIHLDDDNCLEVVIIRGRAGAVRQLGERLRSVRGVKVGELVMASTGAGLH
ncbi:MAG TPA: nickel-responsive transcriptional regulator NikR, partial [bacterium]|nr:nickel-responsive transcriptional regulator NikR [bacterium]